MREKMVSESVFSKVEYEEGKLKSFHREKSCIASYRVYQDEKVGIYCQIGEISDEEGFLRAQKNLEERPRPYPFELESGKRQRDKTERQLTDKELMDTAKECMEYLCEKYPRFVFNVSFDQKWEVENRVNDKGMDYSNTDCCVSVGIGFKHVESKDISDGYFGFSLRDFDKEVFSKMVDNYLGNYEKEVEFPEELIMDIQYYEVVGSLYNHLNGENLSLGTSLLSGKIGEQVFSEKFTLLHDVSDEECWFNTFWDGDGCVTEGDKRVFIDKGRIVTGFADKKIAKRYGIPHTGNAYSDYTDIPGAGGLNFRIERSKKTVKELLDGRYCVVPVMMYGGGFAENGDYVMPVQNSLLCDGEKILGRLPAFSLKTSLYDMFGKDFIGVGSDNPIYNDKQILFRVEKGEI